MSIDIQPTGSVPLPAPALEELILGPKPTIQTAILERAKERTARRETRHTAALAHKIAGDRLLASNPKQAYTQYLSASRLWARNGDIQIALAGCYRALGWYEEAAGSATRALVIDPVRILAYWWVWPNEMQTNIEARYTRGLARLEQRMVDAARVDFEDVLTLLERGVEDKLALNVRARAALVEVDAFLASQPTDLKTPQSINPTLEIDFAYPPITDHGSEAVHPAHAAYLDFDQESTSDSSDCAHVGNGVPCRFYNHDGCVRGEECGYSHAPDERSVRDLLSVCSLLSLGFYLPIFNRGKNVCTYFLLNLCKFGPGKCVYSHRRNALPPGGWWEDEAEVERVKGVLDMGKEVREVVRGGTKRTRKAPNTASAKPKDIAAEVKEDGKEEKKDVLDSAKEEKKPKKQWRPKHQKPRAKAKSPSSQAETKDAQPVAPGL